jgi:hypothetical protein
MTTIKNISLCSLLLATSFAYSDEVVNTVLDDETNTTQNITPEEEIEINKKNTETNLRILDEKIFHFIHNDVRQAKKQKNKDKKALDNCQAQRAEERKTHWFCPTNCTQQARAYEGVGWLNDTGSKRKYYALKRILAQDKIVYDKFKTDFKRCQRFNDNECFKDVDKELRQWINSHYN